MGGAARACGGAVRGSGREVLVSDGAGSDDGGGDAAGVWGRACLRICSCCCVCVNVNVCVTVVVVVLLRIDRNVESDVSVLRCVEGMCD